MEDSPGDRFTWGLLIRPINAAGGGEAELDPCKQGSGWIFRRVGISAQTKGATQGILRVNQGHNWGL